MLHATVNSLGNAVNQYYLAGKMDGVAVVLYEVDGNTLGTHYVAIVQVIYDQVNLTQMAICDYDVARVQFYEVVNKLRATC